MKKTLILVQVIGLTILMACKSGGSGSKSGSPEQPYGEKSGIITYKPMDIMGVKVTQTMYFDEYGRKTMRETMVEGNMGGTELRQHTIDITDGFTMYHYELENIANGMDKTTKDAYKSKLAPEFFEQMYIESLSPALKTKLSYKDEGKETVAGIEGMKYSLTPDSANPEKRITGVHFKNIPLKVSMGPMEMIADKVEIGAKIPAEKFKVPEGYKMIDQTVEGNQQLPADAPETAGSAEPRGH